MRPRSSPWLIPMQLAVGVGEQRVAQLYLMQRQTPCHRSAVGQNRTGLAASWAKGLANYQLGAIFVLDGSTAGVPRPDNFHRLSPACPSGLTRESIPVPKRAGWLYEHPTLFSYRVFAKPVLRAATKASISVLCMVVAMTAAQVLIIRKPSSKRWSSRTTRRAFSSGVV